METEREKVRKQILQTASEIPSDESGDEQLVDKRFDVESEKSTRTSRTSSLDSSAENDDLYSKELSRQVEKDRKNKKLLDMLAEDETSPKPTRMTLEDIQNARKLRHPVQEKYKIYTYYSDPSRSSRYICKS
jgi:hypothetical protein